MLTIESLSDEPCKRLLISCGGPGLHESINVYPAKPTTLQRGHAGTSPLPFDKLPTEILFLILESLDFQALSRLSRVSYRGHALVSRLPAFSEMMTHASDTLAALGASRLITQFPAKLLHQTLRAPQCVSCFDFGAFLFLPTCERICYECIQRNYGYRIVPVNLAKRIFNISEKQIKAIPVIRAIPEQHYVCCPHKHRPNLRLVSTKQAKEVAMAYHGSEEAMLDALSPGYQILPGKSGYRDNSLYLQFLKAPVDPPGEDMSRLPGAGVIARDDYAGMAVIRFPYLKEGGPDRGHVCAGCMEVALQYNRRILPPEELSKLGLSKFYPEPALRAAGYRLRTEDNFLEHIKECHGAQVRLGNRRNMKSYRI